MKKIALAILLGTVLFATAPHTAKVLESMNAAGYTYMKVDDGNNTYWIAMTQREIKNGDTISFTEQGWMKNFHSKTLDRTFDNILFAGDTAETPAQQKVKFKPDIFTSEYKQAHTITLADVFKDRDKLADKKVTIRAKVTKVSKGIMKRNWVHLEDGTRYANRNDLVFTTTGETPAVGEVVTATGTLAKDKDFGYGYFYPVIIEKCSFTK